jgi:hypothetical protein
MENEIQILRDRIDELEEQLRQLQETLVPEKNPFAIIIGNSRQQAALLLGLYKLKFASYKYLDCITEQTSTSSRKTEGANITNRTKVAVFKIRRKLKKYGIKIHASWGEGYYLDDVSYAKLQKLMEG